LLLGSAAWQLAGLSVLTLVPSRWPLIVGGLLADHVLLAGAGLLPRSRLLGPNQDRLSERSAAGGEVALTFDDGPDPEVTPRVLELLDRHPGGAQSTFFCIGKRAAAHPDVVSEIARRGHQVENHTYSHSGWFATYPSPLLRQEVRRTQEVLAEASGRWPQFFRAPAGFRSLLLEPVLCREGLALMSWTRRGFDTIDRNSGRVAGRLLRGVAAGDVLLLHDGGAARHPGGRPVVLDVLERVLEALGRQNLRPIPLGAGAVVRGDEAE
jgi:peptidoglycan/xylan/chitin deacetylase (PgdA/CDA1 family)